MKEIDLSAIQAKAEEINATENARRLNAAGETVGQLKEPPEHDDDRAMLRLIGLDPVKYEQDAERERAEIEKMASAFHSSEPPAELSLEALKSQLLDRNAPGFLAWPSIAKNASIAGTALANNLGVSIPIVLETAELTPPALSATGGHAAAILGEIDAADSTSGEGGSWGWGAIAAPAPVVSTVTFAWVPFENGNLYALARVNVKGSIFIYSHGHGYTETWADLRLTLGCSVQQDFYAASPDLTLVDEHKDHKSSAAYWIQNSYLIQVGTKVIAGQRVFISVSSALTTEARSSHALSSADFASGADHYIRVATIDLYNPPL
jgi:hypothetical protein